jgi:rhombotail lipoprotein
MKTVRSVIYIVLFLSIFGSLTGCAGLYGNRTSRYTSSVVEYLYAGKEHADIPTVTRLSLPLNVGVAFVPESKSGLGKSSLSEQQKMELMDRVSAEFKKLLFVKSIELIPTAYLTPNGGFANLDQIKTMYGVDVIALLSYDQVQHTDEGLLSLSYWTIVGAYIVKGEKNDTSTMIDAAIYDIASRKMLFRAPGTSRVKGSATPVNLSEQLRTDSLDGFRNASDNLVVNLRDQLERFKTKIKEMPQTYVVAHKPGYTGGGSMGTAFSLLLLGLGAFALWRGRKH